LPSSSISFLFWFSIYFFTISMSAHAVLTKYHLLQKFFWHNIFFFQCLLCSIIALLHFKVHTIHATLYFGAIFNSICTWDLLLHFISIFQNHIFYLILVLFLIFLFLQLEKVYFFCILVLLLCGSYNPMSCGIVFHMFLWS
jgi:hypothetical protein